MRKLKRLFLARAAMTLLLAVAAFTTVSAEDEFIYSTDDWNAFVAKVNAGIDASKSYKLMNDIKITTMVGSNENRFKGTFDGQGYTITMTLTHTGGGDAYMAPFRFAESATIKNLHTAGTITSDGKYSAGIVARTEGTVTIQNCWCSVVINSSKSGDGTHGGIISNFASGTVTITNTLFDGKLLTTNGTNQCGGFIGWANVAPTVSNCLYAPAALGTGETEVLDTYDNQNYEGCTFIRPKAKATSSSLVNSYYTRTLNVAQGTDASSMTTDQLVTALGSGWEVKNGKVVPIMQKSPSTWPLTGHIITGFTATGGTGGTGNEGYDKLVDGLFANYTGGWTKWGTSSKGTPSGETGVYYWVDFNASEPINVEKYILTTGNDNSPYNTNYQGRNPKSWELKAKANNNDTWTTIATVENSNMGNIAFKDYEFTLDTPGTYQYFRFMISETTGNNFMQLCELRFKQPIDSKRIESSTISGIQSFYQYTGEAIAINYAVTASDGTSLSDGTDYDVTITKGGNYVTEVKEKGIYELTFTGKGSYSGAKSVTLEVVYEIAIGTATYNSDWRLPVVPSEHYFLTQQIYKEEEIGEAGTITYITFDLAQKDDPDLSMPHVQMFMKNVNKQSFDNETDMVIVGESDKVWEGTLTCSGLGRLKINLDTPFEYDGTSNLLICFYDETAGYQGPNYKFRTHSTTDNTALCYYSATSVPNLNTLSSYDGDKKLCAYRANIKLGITQSDCSNPTDISFSNITINSATVTWEGEGNLWKLQYKASNATEWKEVDGLTTNSYNLTGLASTTVYNVRVLTVCGNGKTSGWKKGDFSTLIYDYPWSEDFEGYSTGDFTDPFWKNEIISDEGTYLFRVSTSTTGDNSTHKLYLPDQADGTMVKLTLPKMELPNGNYLFKLDMYRSSSSSTQKDEGIRVYASTNGNIEGATELAFIPRVYSVGNGTIPAESAANCWYTYELPILTSGDCYIILCGECKNGSSIYMDNFEVKEGPSCIKPTNLEVTNIEPYQADLSWKANGEESAWTVYYKKSSDTEYSSVNVNTTSSYTLENLQPGTKYQFYVVANCSENEESDASVVVSFTTACGAVKQYPWMENFDNYASRAMPICWEKINESTHSTYKAYPYVNLKHLRFYSRFSETTEYDPKDQYAILPEMQNLNGKQTRLTAWTTSSAAGSTFKIVRMVDPADADTFHEIATQELTTTTHTEYIFPLSGVEGNYIAIMIEAANSESPTVNVYIDDVIVEDVPSCQVPTNFSAADIMSRKATLSWDANGANAWILAYKAEGDADFTEVNVTSNPYTLKNLDFLTTYTAKVRACCSETEQSPWSKEISFTTKLIVPTNLALTTFTANTATLSWTEKGDAKAWVVAYKAKSDADYTEVNVNSNPFTLTGLTEDQSYEAKVCADYGDGHRSDWSSKVVEFEPTDKLVIGQFSTSISYTSVVPTNQNYGYALTQQIFTKGELGEANTINSIDFFAHEGTESPRNLDIYMVSTDKESFESTTDGVLVTTDDCVFSGKVTFINDAWTTITLDKSFNYDGQHNVLLVVDDNTGSGETNNYYIFRYYPTSTYQAQYYRTNNSDSNPDPTTLSGFSFYRTTSKNQIRLNKPSTSESADVTFAKEGFGTYYNSARDVELPAGMKARIVTSQGNKGALVYETIADGDTEEKTVPAATAMMLQVAPAMSSHTSPIKLVSPAATAISQTNMLQGSDVATTTTGGAKFYKLSYDTNGENIGWYWGAEGGAAFQSGAHKVWLALPSASSRSFFVLPEYGETEGIVEIERLKVDNCVYDLQGRRMERSTSNVQRSTLKKGIYIINGKKIVIK